MTETKETTTAKTVDTLSMMDMLKAGAHFGHLTAKWHPKMEPYIFTAREKVHIIDLQKTIEALEKALTFIASEASRGKKILFVATKRQARDVVKEAAESCGMPYVTGRWLGGTLTNFETISKQIKKLHDYYQMEKSGQLAKYKKREQLMIKEEIERLEKNVGGIKDLKQLPDALFIIDIDREAIALKEAKVKNIPVVALVDTNVNPEKVDYPIPANDDAIASITLFVNFIAQTVKQNYRAPLSENIKKGIPATKGKGSLLHKKTISVPNSKK